MTATDKNLRLTATSTFGLEAVVQRELKTLGFDDITTADGRLSFAGNAEDICRCNLWLRSADRVLLEIAQFEATDFGQLFDQTNELPWEDWIGKSAAFPVRGKSVKSQLHSVPDCQRIVKKAIVERLKAKYRTDWFEEKGPTYAVECSVHKDRVTLSIDTTGDGLHKRGYRTRQGTAPLRETLAAGLIQLSFWNPTRQLADPMCGSGTIPIEAALIGRNIAPGLKRRFTSEDWPQIGQSVWQRYRDEAKSKIVESLPETIIASDIDPRSIQSAKIHAKQAGVDDNIQFDVADISRFSPRRKYGCVITNPPYGERLGEEAEVRKLYETLGRKLASLETWSHYVLTAWPTFEKDFGSKADRKRKLYNGNIACQWYQYPGPRPPWDATQGNQRLGKDSPR